MLVGKHARFHVRFTPTSASWLNMVERFFRDLPQSRLRRKVLQDLEQLLIAIGKYIDGHNQHLTPFICTAKATNILEKLTRAPHQLETKVLTACDPAAPAHFTVLCRPLHDTW